MLMGLANRQFSKNKRKFQNYTSFENTIFFLSLLLADTSINHFQFDTRQKRLLVYYVFMHMIAQIIIIMMMVGQCRMHTTRISIKIFDFIYSSVCVDVVRAFRNAWKQNFPLNDASHRNRI